MRAIIQRVLQASVSLKAGGVPVSSTEGPGLLVLVGIATDDTEEDVDYITRKILNVRLFNNPPTFVASPAASEPTSPVAPEDDDASASASPGGEMIEVEGKSWAKNVMDTQGAVLMVSQFTLCHTLKGNKPDFHHAMNGGTAQPMFDGMLARMGKAYKPEKIMAGAFGQHMHVSLVNDGPVTITLDSKNRS
jgi:D-tyrosyl-tRNA(Tyr) deacylase